jgi:hypothetical protein
MCSLASGAHNMGFYIIYPSTGLQASIAQYNGLNCLAVGFPYNNLKLIKSHQMVYFY